jgi:ATP-binding cassette subfamily B protein
MPEAAPPRRHGDLALYRRLAREASRWRGAVLGLFLLDLLSAPLALLMPLPVKVVVDHVLGGTPLPPAIAWVVPGGAAASKATLLSASAAALVVVAFLVQAQQMASWLAKTWIGQRLMLGFRARLFEHLQRLSLAWHHRRGSADPVYRLQFDAAAIQGVVVEGAVPFATALVKVAVLLVATFLVDPGLALVALLLGPVLFGLTEVWRRRLRREWSEVRAEESAALAVVQETLGAVRLVKAFGQEERESARYRERGDRQVGAAMRAVKAHATFDLLVGLAVGLGGAAVLVVGARHVQAGILTLGELLLAMAYLSQLFLPLREVGTRFASLQGGLASVERVFQVLDEAPDVVDAPGAARLERAKGAVAFEGVTFGYDPARPVLRDVTLEVPAGSRVGVAGPTGSGKSTLLSLLPRFFDPDRGRVTLDGIDLRAIRLADLRRQFAVVPQEGLLFATSILENIAYGRPGARREEIEEAARAAAAHDFVSALPEGYDTVVGERGLTLSGGERQRITLARAFLRDAPLLLLDEPTSALGVETEAEVMRAIERLMQGRTTFLIAHRLSTLAACDVRLEIRDGAVRRVDADLAGVTLA